MNCQTARESFSDLLDARSNSANESGPRAATVTAARAHLANCPECQREFSSLSQTLAALDALPEPAASPKLRRDFYAMLEEEKHSAASILASARTQRRHHALWRWVLAPLGACALLTLGFLAGTRYGVAPATPPQVVADAETKRQLQDLQAKVNRMETMNQLVAASLQQQQRPANERLHTVLTSAAQENPTDRMINELIASLALDSSPNVRLRALEGLYPHADKEVVRVAVLMSLPRESNPLVQVAMIDFLASAREHDAKPALEKLMANDQVDENVRVAAKRALAQL